MLRKFKITFITPKGRKNEVVLEATSKYDAKLRFFRISEVNLKSDIEKIEEVESNV